VKNKKISSYALAAILVILVTLAFIFIFSPGVTSSVVNSIPTDPPDADTLDTGIIPDNPDYSRVEITKDNVQAVIRAMARPTEYYYETQSTLFYSGGSRSYPRKKWSNGKQERVDIISENGTTTMTVIYSGNNVYMWRPGHNRYYKTTSGEFTSDSTQMIMVYEDILALDATNITDAKYMIYNSVPCIYVEASNPLTGYTDKYWISTDTGLLSFGQIFNKENAIIYSVEAKQTTTATQDPSLFLLPTGDAIPTE